MGYAIKLSGKDFSGNNLGQVTFIGSYREQSAALADAYCTTINDNTYKAELEDFFCELMLAGLWDKIYSIYPMLGSSLLQLSLNAKDINSRSLVTFANASAGSKKIVFTNVIGTGDTTSPSISELGKYAIYCVVKRDTDSINSSALLRHIGNINFGLNSAYYDNTRQFFAAIGSSYDYLGASGSTIHRFGAKIDDDKFTIIDGGVARASVSNAYAGTIRPNLALGCATGKTIGTSGASITDSADLFDGDVHFYAIGLMSVADLIVFDGLAAGFLASVKEI